MSAVLVPVAESGGQVCHRAPPVTRRQLRARGTSPGRTCATQAGVDDRAQAPVTVRQRGVVGPRHHRSTAHLPSGRTRDLRAPGDPAAVARPLVLGVLEVLAGARPAHQLRGALEPAVLRDLDSRARRLARSRSGRQVLRSAVLSVRATHPVPAVAEVAAVVQRGQRCGAVALRLEVRHGRWRATALELS